jgi:Glycosyltransferases involved in cell wall biogenesis
MNKLLSLCMIVKNEEKVLQRCLDSVQGLVDEIIVVDTGSQDRTKEIASSYTDRVYDFEWINDFSAAKNAAIRRATSQWILVLDADEYVGKEQHEELRSLLTGLDPTKPLGLIVPIYNFTETNSTKFVESSALRVFLNHPDICFERPIHEQVTYQSKELPYANYPFIIYHTGYTQETMAEKKKNERNLQLFKELKEKKNFEEYDHFTLGNEYHTAGDIKKALSHYQKALEKNVENMTFYPYCLDQAIVCLFKLDRLKEALVYIEQGLKKWPQYADYYCFKAIAYEALGLVDEAISLYERAIEIADSPPHADGKYWVVSPTYGNLVPFRNLNKLYSQKMDLNKAVYYLTKLVQLNPNDHVTLYQLLSFLTQQDTAENLLGFMMRIYPEPSGPQSLQLLQVCLLLGHKELSDYYYSLCASKGISLLPHHRLYYALLRRDRTAFESEQNALTDNNNQAQINKLLTLGSIIWQDPRYAELATPPILDYDSLEPATIVTLLIELFRMNEYEAYDSLIERYPQYRHSIANRLGDHFFHQFQFELAIDYYSLLLNGGQLEAAGFRNIALLYMNQGEIEEGLGFIEQALKLNPKQTDLFVLYLMNCSEPDQRKRMLEWFRIEYTQYTSIPILRQKIKD